MVFMKYPHMTSTFPSNVDAIEKADVIVFGIPYDSTVDYLSGTRFGPKAIREAVNFIEPFDMELRKNFLEAVRIIDIGDLEPVRGNSKETVKRIEEQTFEILGNNKFPLVLGGEHTISLGIAKALPENSRIVCFDAHYDLKEVWEGSKITHVTWLRRACEILGSENVCLIGVRTGDEFEHEYARKERMLVNPNIKEFDDFVKEQRVHLTIDMDVFDPSIAPGVGTPEPDGMSYEEVIRLLRLIPRSGNLISFDVSELRPLPENKITEMLAAKTIFKVLTHVFC